MRLFLLLVILLTSHYMSWGQVETILYHNGFEELLEFEGEIPEQDSIEITVFTDYNTVDWNHWSPRLSIARMPYDYEGDWFPTYYLRSNLGTYNVSSYDSLVVDFNAYVAHGSGGIELQCVINNEDTVSYLTRKYVSYSCGECTCSGWNSCKKSLIVNNTGIETIQFYLELPVTAYNWSSYNNMPYINLRFDDLTITGYSSMTDTEEILCQSDLDGDGGVGAMDLIIMLAGYGMTCD